MDRERILEQSRKTGMDERELSIEKESGFIGLLAVIALAALFEMYKIINGLPFSDMVAIISIQIAATSYYKYKKLPERKIFLAGAIVAVVATITAIAAFFLGK